MKNLTKFNNLKVTNNNKLYRPGIYALTRGDLEVLLNPKSAFAQRKVDYTIKTAYELEVELRYPFSISHTKISFAMDHRSNIWISWFSDLTKVENKKYCEVHWNLKQK